ncbi:MAG: hypothetical protein A2729_03575 [Candidatus Buchananbacteria bacterium RIFCSPHIGHO2_01_FULL_39_14]|uniref:SET domain-containing protein n=1 Tax=Candidatus Buchananbacteria bacterium RIFCSPHIGHO2_01_FULL_39_14 TaxID=1797532 RepID=A0A1G1XXH5_9BACT|nr:MAG: hypothetical protein A2729_03575 [Candidatus Buchananbacteria bacterium RIFCSPHIGHO2_01_FULL_39_14]
MKKTSVRQTPKTGAGLFAIEKISQNEPIFAIEGNLRHDAYTKEEALTEFVNDLNIAPGIWITPHDTNPWRYVNHSCNPNIGLKQINTTFIAIALCNIKAEEELTIDYSITENNPYWQLQESCACQTQNCRKIIRAASTLPPALFEKYQPYMLPFMIEDWKQQNLAIEIPTIVPTPSLNSRN